MDVYSKNAEYYQSLGESFEKNNQLNEAMDCYQKAIDIHSCWFKPHYSLGQILEKQRCIDLAKSSYLKAIELNFKFAWSHFRLACILEKQGFLEEAINYCKNAILVNPPDKSVWFYIKLGDILIKKGCLKEAIQNYLQSSKINSNLYDSKHKLGLAYAKQKNWEEAVSAYREALELQPNSPLLHLELGQILEREGLLEDSINSYRQALSLQPKNVSNPGNIASCRILIKALIESYEKYGTGVAKKSRYFVDLSKELLIQKKHEDAIACAYIALQINPAFREAFITLGDILKTQGLDSFASVCYHGKLPEYLLTRLGLCKQSRFYKIVSSSSKSQEIQHIEIYSHIKDSLEPPITIDKVIPPNFRDKNFSSSAFVAIAENVRVWGDHSNSAVITSREELIADISSGNPEIVMSSDKLPRAHSIDGNVVFISGAYAVQNYYHWLVDVLPRIHLLRQAEINLDEVDKFIFNRHAASYHHETLAHFSISSDKILQSHEYPHIYARRVIVPSAPFRGNNPKEIRISKWVCEFLKKEFIHDLTPTLSRKRRFYVSRSQSSSRQILNEEILIQHLHKYNFEKIEFEGLSIYEQASLMFQAEVVIAPHGAGLANLVFCQPETKVIEIFSPNYVNACYWMLSSQCQLKYGYLICTGTSNEEVSTSQGIHPFKSAENICVNLDNLSHILDILAIK